MVHKKRGHIGLKICLGHTSRFITFGSLEAETQILRWYAVIKSGPTVGPESYPTPNC